MRNRSTILIWLLAFTSFAAIDDAIGGSPFALVPGAPSRTGYACLAQSNEFHYLCGVEALHSCVLLDEAQRHAAVCLPHRNEGWERADGKELSIEEEVLTKHRAGIDFVADQFIRYARINSKRRLFAAFSPAEGAAVSRDLAGRSTEDAAADPINRRSPSEGSLILSMRLLFSQVEVLT